MRGRPDHVVHLELRTSSLARACSFYTQLFDWRVERIEACGASYPSLDLGPSIEGGVVEQDAGHAVWLSEIWSSREEFEAQGEKLMPILSDMGIEFSAEPEIFEVQNLVK